MAVGAITVMVKSILDMAFDLLVSFNYNLKSVTFIPRNLRNFME